MDLSLFPKGTLDVIFIILITIIFILSLVIFFIGTKLTLKNMKSEQNPDDPKHFTINPYDKYHTVPKLYWEERIFLGKYIDIKGTKWDLGIKVINNKIIDCSISKKDNTNPNIDTKNSNLSEASHIKEIKRRLRILNLDKLMNLK